jgi:hypothetical protein
MKHEFQYELEQQIWLRALESGDFPQTTDHLHCRYENQDAFCCLGVACEVLKIDKILLGDQYAYGRLESNTVLPDEARARLRLRSNAGEARVPFEIRGRMYKNLADANDGGATHQEIAAVIRANPANFFLEGV